MVLTEERIDIINELKDSHDARISALMVITLSFF